MPEIREPRRTLAMHEFAQDGDAPGDAATGLAEQVARAAELARPRSCPFCEGPGAYGPHDPACPAR